jgi:hypothetical protein
MSFSHEPDHDVVVVGARCAAPLPCSSRVGLDVLVVDRSPCRATLLSTHAISRRRGELDAGACWTR